MNLRHKNHPIQVYLRNCSPFLSFFFFFVYRLGTRGVVSHPFPPRNEFPLLRPNRHVPGCFLRPYAPGAIAHSAKIALHCASWRRYATACSSNFGHWTSLDMWPEPRVHKVSRNSGCLHIRRAKGGCSWLLRRRDWTDVDGSVKETLGGIFFSLWKIRREIYSKGSIREKRGPCRFSNFPFSKTRIFIFGWLEFLRREFSKTKKFVIPE